MADNDPFSAFESDRTIIKPRAGRAQRPDAGAPPPPAPAAPADASPPELPRVAGFDPLLQAAAPLLRAVPQIRATTAHPNPAALRATLADGVRRFESDARAAGVANEHVVAGRYLLCTALDEAASSTPWGSAAWGANSLLVAFHNEAWGGEKVFQLMGKLAEDVPRHRPLLELMYVVLALGFEGRYRVLDNGRAQLDGVRERLAQLLRQHGAAVEPELSPRWRGVQGDAKLRHGIPVWVAAAATAFVLMLVFVALRFAINDRSDATFAALQGLSVKAAPVVAPPPPATPAPPRLAVLLKDDIAAGRVEVRDLADRSVVTVRADEFFDPASAHVDERFHPLIARIGAALNRLPGPILVTGHTDSRPIRTLRYPSNWHLSRERADAVSALLAATVKPERLRAEGRADAEPIGDNATAAGRALNRRVEITLSAAAG